MTSNSNGKNIINDSRSSILNCKGLSYQFAHSILFSNLSFELKSQEFISICGENGSGKTTLLKILAGLLKPTQGRIDCCNEQIWPQKKVHFEHKSIYLSYIPSFYTAQSVLENLDFYLKCYDMNSTIENKYEALKKVDLLHKRNEPVNTLSTGQKRRLTLALLTLLKPRLVLADEPTNGLDTFGTELCFETFQNLMKNENTAFVVATHDNEFKKLSTQTLSLNDFKLHLKNEQKIKITHLL